MFLDNSEVNPCLFCERNIQLKDYKQIVNQALHRKHGKEHNDMYYIKDLNNIMKGRRCKAMVHLREWIWDEPGQECLRRFYQQFEFEDRISKLAEYLSYETPRPKTFVSSVMRPLKNYYYYRDKIKQTNGKLMITDDSSEPANSGVRFGVLTSDKFSNRKRENTGLLQPALTRTDGRSRRST